MTKRRRSTSDIADERARKRFTVRFCFDENSEPKTPPAHKRERAVLGEAAFEPRKQTPHPLARFRSRSARNLKRRLSFDERTSRAGARRNRDPENQESRDEILVQYMEWTSEFNEDAMELIDNARWSDRDTRNEAEIQLGVTVDVKTDEEKVSMADEKDSKTAATGSGSQG